MSVSVVVHLISDHKEKQYRIISHTTTYRNRPNACASDAACNKWFTSLITSSIAFVVGGARDKLDSAADWRDKFDRKLC